MSVSPDTYKIIRSKRKTISIEITPECEVIVRAPKWVALREIRYFIDEKESWIKKALINMEKKRAASTDENIHVLSADELELLIKKAKDIIPERVKYYANLIGVSYGKISIKNQKTRWGSCSAKGNLSFNCLLMLAPTEVLDAIIVHELCHRLEMNHSKAFYNEIYKAYPDYDKWNKWLKDNGERLQKMNPK